jgi:hypothetical protein
MVVRLTGITDADVRGRTRALFDKILHQIHRLTPQPPPLPE